MSKLIIILSLLTAVTFSSSLLAESKIATGYTLQQLVAPSPFCGVHGLGIDANDNLYAGSVAGRRLYSVDKISGAVDVLVGPPNGMADDMEFLPDGTLVWTSISQNAVRARSPSGEVRDLATDLRSVNSIAYRESDGRLFVAQVFGGDGLWELDIKGEKPPRNILKDLGGLNGFDIGPDGMIYGPLWFKQQVVKINPDDGALTVIADGFHTPAAANFDSNWNLYVLDTGTGEIINVDIKTGAKTRFAQLKTSLDNLAIDSKDILYVSNMADNGIQAIDIKTKAIRAVVEEGLSCPSGIAVAAGTNSKADTIYVADYFALRKIDGNSGMVTDIARSHAANTTIGYARNVFVGAKHYYVSSSRTLLEFDRDTDQLVGQLDHIAGAQFIAELKNGDLLAISQRGQRLTRYSGENKKTEVVISETLGGASSLALIDKNTVLATLIDDNVLVRIDLQSGKLEKLAIQLDTPVDIAVSVDKQWLIRESQGRVVSINPINMDVNTIVENFTSGRMNDGIGNRSHSFGVGQTGMYLLSDVNNAIYKLSTR